MWGFTFVGIFTFVGLTRIGKQLLTWDGSGANNFLSCSISLGGSTSDDLGVRKRMMERRLMVGFCGGGGLAGGDSWMLDIDPMSSTDSTSWSLLLKDILVMADRLAMGKDNSHWPLPRFRTENNNKDKQR